MRVVSVTVPVVAKPKRRHPEIDNSGTKPGEAKGSNAEEYVQKAKRLKVANEPKPKVVKKQTILRSPASIGRLTAATRAKRVSLTKRRRSGDASKGSRTPLAHRAQGVGPKPTKPLDKVTVPHAFTFRSGRRLDLKKAQAENARPQPSKVSTLTFKPAHHPAVLNRPTVASLNRALATVNHPNAPSSAHPTPKPSTLASGHKLKPTVPQSTKFATDTRMKDRLVFDEAIRKKEEEKRKLEEAEKLDEARRKDDEVRALRKALDDHLRANVHNVPEWYKERPKLTQRKEAN
ncbi:hypothetical protein FRB99_002893 [Tulasnella sp. 403]|nr:hypothetical protein FRB99_002893 [Tulasnella sp. 403]